MNIIKLGFALSIGLICFSSCEDKTLEEYTRYDPTPINNSNANLTYLPVVSYPELAKIETDTPTYVVDGVYIFRLDTVTAAEGGAFSLNKFSINKQSGVVTYDNSDGSILPGFYYVGVSISNPTGLAVFDQASEFEVLDVPISLSVDNPTVNAGALQQGVIATVSYTDDSPDGSITSVEYSLAPPVTGFSIDPSTGVISKTTEAETGVNALSVAVVTNLGAKSFANVVTVTIGPPPTIQYLQADGTSDLSLVTLSPWTAYTTIPPVLKDMVATEWEILLPAGLDPAAVSIAADGSFSVLAAQNITTGDHLIGVKAINASGASFEFPDQFVLHFEKRWEASPVFYEDFNNTTTTPVAVDVYNPALASYSVNSGGIELFNAVFSENLTKDRLFQSAKMRDGANDIQMEAVLILAVTIDPSWYNMRVSFNELFGYGSNRLDWWQRTLGFSYDDSGVAAGTYDPANWNILMEATDPEWSGAPGTVNGARDTDMNPISPKDFGGLDNTQSTVFINWYIGETSAATVTQKGAEFHVDNLNVEVSGAFPAEEE